MSKNKNYHNYKNYSNNKPQTEEVTPEVVDAQEEVTVEVKVEEEATPVQEEVTPAPVPAPQPKEKPTIGVVANCPRLRVRAAASINAEVLCEIESGSEVTIDKSKSTKDFYAVCTSAGVEGFCMKKFIIVI